MALAPQLINIAPAHEFILYTVYCISLELICDFSSRANKYSPSALANVLL